MRETIKLWLLLAVAILFIAGLGAVISGVNLAGYKFWAPKREAARREVFQQSASFVQGKQQYLTRIHAEWLMADSSHKEVLCGVARHEASTLDADLLPESVKGWTCVR